MIESFHIRSEVEDIDYQPVGIAVTAGVGNITVRNCKVDSFQVGIEINSAGGTLTIENNDVSRNIWGISSLHNSNLVIIRNNVVSNNRYGLYSADSNVQVKDNIISDNQYGVHIATRIENSVPAFSIFQGNRITNNLMRGLWFDQATFSLNTTVDLGGGPRSLGENTIGNNGKEDLINDSHGIIYASNNDWLTKNVINVQGDADVVLDSN